MPWIFLAILIAAAIHVVEESVANWVGWANRVGLVKATWAQFAVVNFLFILLCASALLVWKKAPVFSLSVAALIFVNAWFHILPTVRFNKYSPGLVSAVVLFLPLSIVAYYFSARVGYVSTEGAVLSGVLGLLWMSGPIVFRLVRLRLAKR